MSMPNGGIYKGAIECKITSAYSVSVSESTKNAGVIDTSTYTDTDICLKNGFIVGQNLDWEHAENSVC